MKRFKFSILSIIISMFTFISCNSSETKKADDIPSRNNDTLAESNDDKQISSSEKAIGVYYFHYSRRCETCNAVENVARDVVNNKFANRVRSGKLFFEAINLDLEESITISEKLGIDEQALIIVKGSEQVNLTSEGFMYAKTDPLKFTKILKQEVVKML